LLRSRPSGPRPGVTRVDAAAGARSAARHWAGRANGAAVRRAAVCTRRERRRRAQAARQSRAAGPRSAAAPRAPGARRGSDSPACEGRGTHRRTPRAKRRRQLLGRGRERTPRAQARHGQLPFRTGDWSGKTVPAKNGHVGGTAQRSRSKPASPARAGARRACSRHAGGGIAMAPQGAWREGRRHSRQSAGSRRRARLRRGSRPRPRETLAPCACCAAATRRCVALPV
jgi:hypothetical protein